MPIGERGMSFVAIYQLRHQRFVEYSVISKLSNFHTIIDSNFKIQNFHFTQEIANYEYDVHFAYHLKNSSI